MFARGENEKHRDSKAFFQKKEVGSIFSIQKMVKAGGSSSFIRSLFEATKVFKIPEFLCDICEKHCLFISKKSGKNYI